jgi:hypothetical protein
MADNLIQQGKALVLAIQGLQALEDVGLKISVAETHVRPSLIKTYQRELKNLLARVSPERAAEILAAMRTLNLPPTLGPGLN